MGNKITERKKVLDNIDLALQNYLGSGVTVTLIPVYNSGCAPGVITSATTNIMVMPDITGTHLVYNSIVPFFSVGLFLCGTKGSTEVRFLYAWNIGAKWYIGAPYLSEIEKTPLPMQVLISQEDITKQVNGRNPVAAIQNALGTMMFGVPGQPGLPGPGILLKYDKFAWTRSREDEDNFQVYKTASAKTFYWNAGGIETLPVTLTDNKAKGGRFKFTQI